MSWQLLEDHHPALAAFGAERLNGQVAYLATVRKDGAPRVHPVTPIIGHGRLFVFMEPTSPKGHDLRRDGRYALHCAVGDTTGASGEFTVTGRAQLVVDAEQRALAAGLARYTPKDRYLLFAFEVEGAASTRYPDDQPERLAWKAAGAHGDEAPSGGLR